MAGECRASISGNCLSLSMGWTYCREGECVEGEYNDWAEQERQAAADRPAPRRAVRRPRKVKADDAGP